jgi:dephospho-CoA kinase
MKIAVCGGIRSGKDTFAAYFTDRLGFYKFAFADGIHEVINRYFPESYDNGKPREHLQVIGQTFRQFNPDIWVEFLDNELKDHYSYFLKEEQTGVVITDLRQPNEYKYLRENGFTIVRIVADLHTRVDRAIDQGDLFQEANFHHDTETYFQGFEVDFEIENNGSLEELHEKAEWVYCEVKNHAR